LRWKINKIATSQNLSIPSTLAINTVGSFILAGATQLVQSKHLSTNHLLFLGTGFCGSFTTFSTFSVDVLSLVRKEMIFKAFSLVAMTNFCGLGAAFAGIKLAQKVAVKSYK